MCKSYQSVGSLMISCKDGTDCIISSLKSHESAIRLMLAALEQPETVSIMLTLGKQRELAR